MKSGHLSNYDTFNTFHFYKYIDNEPEDTYVIHIFEVSSMYGKSGHLVDPKVSAYDRARPQHID